MEEYWEKFQTIQEFYDYIQMYGELVFTWQEIEYGISWDGHRYCVAYADGSHEQWYDTIDGILEYIVGKDRLRDVITQVTFLY